MGTPRLAHPRTYPGGTRRYSSADLTRIARITALVADGVNIAGIGRILDLEDTNTALREDVQGLQGSQSAPAGDGSRSQ